MHVSVKSLPAHIQYILVTASKYGKSDIEVIHTDSVHLGDSGAGKGRRAFTILINLETGEYKKFNGSWGGVNMFNPDNPVDTDNEVYPLIPGALVIKGSVGYPMTYATIYAHKESSLLPLDTGVEVPKNLLNALFCYGRIKGGQYRKDEMRRHNVTEDDVLMCVAKGWIKVNRAGSGQITTEGKNALGKYGQNGYIPQN